MGANVEITYLGHSSFRIKGKKQSLVTDPYDPKKVGFKFPKVSADLVTVSHDHDDHNKSELVAGVKKVISTPGEYEIGGVSIIGISSFHDDKKGTERGKNTIFVIEMDNLRVVHLGDLGHTLKEEKINGIGDVDILMIPVGGKYTIGPEKALQVSQSLEPKIIIPMHYQIKGLNPKVFSELVGVDLFISALGMEATKMERLKVDESSLLIDGQSLIVLTKK